MINIILGISLTINVLFIGIFLIYYKLKIKTNSLTKFFKGDVANEDKTIFNSFFDINN